MGEDSERFRSRARQCRALASAARNQQDRETLIQMAVDLEAEAATIDAQEASKKPRPQDE